MAKKKATKPSSASKKNGPPGEAVDERHEQTEEQVDRSPKVRKAVEAVDRAKAELEKAQARYRKVRDDAAERLRKVREKTLGDLIDGTLEAVKKHPGPGVLVAALIGVFLGRLFRR